MEVHGIADYVITGGRVVVDEGELKVVQGGGRFVPNPPHSPYVYERIKEAEEVSYLLSSMYRVVQLNFTPEMEVFYSIYDV